MLTTDRETEHIRTEVAATTKGVITKGVIKSRSDPLKKKDKISVLRLMR